MLQRNLQVAKDKLDIVFEDGHIVAVNKPAGMLTISDREQSEKPLKQLLSEKYGNIFTVHRLDKDTSGLILFAKNDHTHKFLSKLFEERKIEKFYCGIVCGLPAQINGEINAPIAEHPVQKGTMYVHRNGKASKTSYDVLEANRFYSLVKFQLHTGRTHQIRVHAKEIGHPLACDPLYGDGKAILLSSVKKKYKLSKHEENERPILNRLALHAFQLRFVNPDGKQILLEAPLPKEFRALMNQLKKLH